MDHQCLLCFTVRLCVCNKALVLNKISFFIKLTLSSFSFLSPVLLAVCFLCHHCPPSWQNCTLLYIPESGKGCSCCPQRSPPCLCETASCPLAQTPWPPSEPGRVEQLWGETLHLCKTPRSASGNWEQHPQRLTLWSILREHGGVSCSDAPPPESAGQEWCCAKAGWLQRALRNLFEDREEIRRQGFKQG